ncbi:hypothetical protein CBE01nite_29590 [Clostridium beijerinckii]|uniref:Hemolysin XhlA family protein n=1 Tax=Clostridium beijerinckii TaxID=1520 RepID=A0AB74VDE1_CLOBE|nr:hemolysin XhlA family protein [Clostridium beijerinckii]NRZ28739.1 hypothetical protein [Clostridium beijerinckii]NYB95485.1 hypothetical protein [Clostridium beijerinckii]OOM24600.1 hemolysin XhlA [Clostridium beijerinckii]QUN34417.1 hemolysin XhlA family protein [Clostridium beijerinckii]SQB00629.1 Haemolysin XhlA [Clostridium beijerinckii]
MDESTVQSILQRLTKIETLLEVDVKNLEDRVDKDYKNMDVRISKIESNNTWLWRTIVGAIIGVVIGAVTITFK